MTDPTSERDRLADEWCLAEALSAHRCCESCGQNYQNRIRNPGHDHKAFRAGYNARDAEVSRLKSLLAQTTKALKESDCTCGGEESDGRESGCYKHEALDAISSSGFGKGEQS